MATRQKASVGRHLRTLFNVGAVGDMTDGQLLERFATGSGEAAELAFAALVERHGPIVFDTCLSILRDEHDAQDAFQATFLVLVRKARSLWVRDSLGPWLHQVAFRAARHARTTCARRAAHERKVAEMHSKREVVLGPDHEDEGFRAALHEEVERLPERYRVPIVLCDLEGRTHEQAARHLGCPVGTVKSRLARGRARLKDRLTRRGVAPAVFLATGLVSRAARGASWADLTIVAAMQNSSGGPLAGAVPAAVIALMKSVTREIFMSKAKGVALVWLTIGAFAGAIGLATPGIRGAIGGQEDPSNPGASRPVANQGGPRGGGPGREDRDVVDIRGQWEVLYLAGSVAGGRLGYPTPGLVVPVTDGTINLPSLTGKAEAPMSYLGRMTYTLDPQRKPGEIDMKAGPAGGKALRGIYRLKGDILTICYDDSDRMRPATFADNKVSEGLIILRRVPPESAPAPPSRPGDPLPKPTRPDLGKER